MQKIFGFIGWTKKGNLRLSSSNQENKSQLKFWANFLKFSIFNKNDFLYNEF